MVLLTWVEWKDGVTNTGSLLNNPLPDVIDIVARKGLNVKNNIATMNLKNSNNKYIDENGLFRFKENDVFDIYVKETTDAADIWNDWKSSDYLLGTYFLKEITPTSTAETNRIKIQAIDKAYVLFNKVYANSYGFTSGDYWTAPGVFRSTTRVNSSIDSESIGFNGTDNDAGTRFDIDARFVSEGGNITDYRPNPTTYLNGSITTGDSTIDVLSTTGFESDGGTLVIGGEHIYYSGITATSFTGCVRGIDDTSPEAHADSSIVYQGFPTLLFSKAWKPIYEWLSELGQPLNTNYASEQVSGGTLSYDRSFLLWVDKDNTIHYVPTSNDVDTTLEVGDNQIYECILTKAVFDSVNMVIYNVGTDMNGAGLTWYWYNENSETNDLKMRYQPMIDVIPQLLLEWQRFAESNGITIETTPANDTLRRYPSDGEYPLSNWSFKTESNAWRNRNGELARTELADDGEFNESLREAAQYIGLQKAQNITSRVGGLRYKGTITLRGDYYNPGDLLQVTDSKTGISNQKLRVMDVTHSITKGQWNTNLSVEEDEEAIIA